MPPESVPVKIRRVIRDKGLPHPPLRGPPSPEGKAFGEVAGSSPACPTSGMAANAPWVMEQKQGREVLRKVITMNMVKWILQTILPEHLACEDSRFTPAGKNPKVAHRKRVSWYTSGFE